MDFPKAVRLFLGFTLIALLARGEARAPARFHDGERWAVLGDSITHNGNYFEYVRLYYLTRFPTKSLNVYNCGILGDLSAGGRQRLGWDVMTHFPTTVSVMFGMNDVGRGYYDVRYQRDDVRSKREGQLEKFRTNMTAIVEELRAHDVRVILCTPSPFDETADLEAPRQAGVNAALGECSEFVRELAEQNGCELVDFHLPMTRLTETQQVSDKAFTLTGADRIHPGNLGNLTMAYLFLQAQGVPSEVSRLSIDAGEKRVTHVSAGGAVRKLKRNSKGLSFYWKESALPLPVPVDARRITQLVPFHDDLNREILRVTGLTASRHWLLRIDGGEIRAYSAEELAQGVNLGKESSTPQNRQAAEVFAVLDRRAKLVASGLRNLALVEQMLAPDAERPLTLETMRPRVLEKLEAIKTTLVAEPVAAALASYLDRKPHEAATEAEAARLLDLAKRLAVPREHFLELVPVE